MTAARDGWVALGSAAVALSLCVYACGGPSQDAKGPAMSAEVAGVAPDDRSRCDYKGRGDREVVESEGPGAKRANIRRVYGVVGEGEDRHRVLLCREVDTNLDGVKDVVRTYTDKGDALNEVADTNFDGKMDTWITFTKGRVSKLRIDHNGDGQDDETRFYVGGQLSRAQIDTNYDGKPDVWEIYDDGKLERRGVDLDFDGHVDRWDRDEIALREIEQKDEAAEKAAAAADAGAASGSGGAAATAARSR
ncbi:MAG TPA: hypothetical protein VGF76_03135 [Polyangiaceae bacterium]